MRRIIALVLVKVGVYYVTITVGPFAAAREAVPHVIVDMGARVMGTECASELAVSGGAIGSHGVLFRSGC